VEDELPDAIQPPDEQPAEDSLGEALPVTQAALAETG